MSETGLFQELKQRKVYRVAVAYLIVAWVALQFLDIVLDNVNAPDWVMQTSMALLAIGFPIAIVLAWAFDVTPEGIKATPARSRAFSVLVVVVSVGAVAVAVWSFLGPDDATTEDAGPVAAEIRVIDSIAVLPFESFSEDRSDEYFADGLADTLLHKLAQLPDLKVIARNSSFQFKGTNKDAREIGELLEVGALLEGSVQRQGTQVRIIVQLIDTTDGAHIWSATFDDSMQNIFEVQDRIATDIMEQLQISISSQDYLRVLRNGTDSPEAYDLLLRANELGSQVDRGAFDPDTDSILALIDRALEIDPNYAQAWTARSSMFSGAIFMGDASSRATEYLEEARAAALKAIEADPEYAGGHTALGVTYFRERNAPEAEIHFVRALELDPSSTWPMAILGLIRVPSDPQGALDIFTRVRELDPGSSFVYRQLSFAYRALGRREEGLAILLEGVERFPDHPVLLADVMSTYLGVYGRPDEAARWASRIVEAGSSNRIGPSTMAGVWGSVDDLERARAWLALYERRFPEALDVYLNRFAFLMKEGEAAAARELLESVPEGPDFRFDRSQRLAGACLLLGDADCAREHADRMQYWLDTYEARGQSFGPGVRYELAITVLRNAIIESVDERDVQGIQQALDRTADWPVTGGRGFRSVTYMRAMLKSLLEDDAAAIDELQKTLGLANDGMITSDIFRMPPELNPLIARLEGQPGYAEWRAELNARREGARGRMLQMERDGEILSADDVAL